MNRRGFLTGILLAPLAKPLMAVWPRAEPELTMDMIVNAAQDHALYGKSVVELYEPMERLHNEELSRDLDALIRHYKGDQWTPQQLKDLKGVVPK